MGEIKGDMKLNIVEIPALRKYVGRHVATIPVGTSLEIKAGDGIVIEFECDDHEHVCEINVNMHCVLPVNP